MKKFIKIKSLAELGKLRDKCVFLAGGTDIYVALNDGALEDEVLCDISSLKGLDKIELKGKNINIGALTTFASIARSPVIKKYAACLAEAAATVGSPQIRNRATIGGNVANGSPSGDAIPALYALGAVIKTNLRSVPADKFFTGPKKTVLKKNELITGISIPGKNNKSFFSKIGPRKALAISKVSTAVSLVISGGLIREAGIAFGAVGPTVIRAAETEKFLKGKKLNEAVISLAAKTAAGEICPIDDFRSTAKYRRETAAVIIERALLKAI
ncbi:MAG: xanthine dehydrogenase family protein subunit M [Elusimicrobiota bacterium]|nr:xanthine dehydrogenase family protein subunit M [Elusimicrobiota bacterium]